MRGLLEIVLGCVDDAILIGRDDVVEEVNPAFVRLSGRSRERCVGRAFRELRVTGEHASILRESGAPVPVQIEVREADGRTIEILRERVDRRAGADRYRLLAENASDLITTIDASGTITYASPSARRVLGYEPEELVGTSVFDLMHPDDRAARSARLVHLASTPDDALPVMIARMRHKSGRHVHLEMTNKLLRGDDGVFVTLESISRDVTARVEAEQALARTEESFRALILALPDPAILHCDGRVILANPAIVALLGFSRAEELLGTEVRTLIHANDRELVATRVAANPHGSRFAEHRLAARDGSAIDALVSSMPLLLGGKLVRLAIAQDRRAQKRVEAELALAERLASLGRLASAVGHEINNPLTYVLGTLDLLEDELARSGGDDALRAGLATVREGTERVRDIVRDLRSLSSPERTVSPEEFCDLGRVIELAAATAAHEIRHRARLVVELGEPTRIVGAEGRLVQVFVNLLVNAAQSIADGAVDDNEIRVVSRRVGAVIEVEVHDTGTGISAEDAPRIFDSFFTTKPAGVGTGLGLAIVQRIVADVGGAIAAEPRAPRGSTFRLALPIGEARTPSGASAS